MIGRHEITLPELAAQLESKYPGVKVIEAYVMTAAAEYGGRPVCQVLRFVAPLGRLLAAGLMTREMIAYGRGVDSRRRRRRPPVGDDFHIWYRAIDAPSVPENWWDLTIYTNLEHDERGDRKDLTEARRVLRRIAGVTP